MEESADRQSSNLSGGEKIYNPGKTVMCFTFKRVITFSNILSTFSNLLHTFS